MVDALAIYVMPDKSTYAAAKFEDTDTFKRDLFDLKQARSGPTRCSSTAEECHVLIQHCPGTALALRCPSADPTASLRGLFGLGRAMASPRRTGDQAPLLSAEDPSTNLYEDTSP